MCCLSAQSVMMMTWKITTKISLPESDAGYKFADVAEWPTAFIMMLDKRWGKHVLPRCLHKYRVFQKDLNIFYSGHQGHRTWHPVIFFLWGYVKDNAYKPPLPQNVRELQDRIRAAVKPLMGTCSSASGRRDYRIDICRVMKGAHIEHLWADSGKLATLTLLMCEIVSYFDN